MNSNNVLYNFLIEHITLEFSIKFVIIYSLLLWFFLILWVAKDISSRSTNILYWLISLLLVTIGTPIWVLFYLIIRPRSTLYEDSVDEIDSNLDCLCAEIKEKVWKENFEKIKCQNCDNEVERDFKYCPYCRNLLVSKCQQCDKLLNIDWNNCPYCGYEKWLSSDSRKIKLVAKKTEKNSF